MRRLGLLFLPLALAGCRDDAKPVDTDDPAVTDSDTDTDADADTDADSDADTDTDTDTDTDADTDADPNVPPEDPTFDGDRVLLVSLSDRAGRFAVNGDEEPEISLADYVPRCVNNRYCLVEGVTEDGDGLWVNWVDAGEGYNGGLFRLDPGTSGPELIWDTDGMQYPHETVRDPTGPYLIVADAFANTVAWLPDDGSGDFSAPIAFLDPSNNGEPTAQLPNGLQVFEWDGRALLLTSYRTDDFEEPGDTNGSIVLWDITDRQNVTKVWRYPETGTVYAPHNPTLHVRDGEWILTYAQPLGYRGDTGTIGIAVAPDPFTGPAYVMDLVPTDAVVWSFPRGVLLTADDVLYVTDTGVARVEGTVSFGSLPTDLTPSTKGGTYNEAGTDQTFVTLEDVEVFVTGLTTGYRSIIWNPTW